jgi:short subunit dehydrogenase-like uncharacterized protein
MNKLMIYGATGYTGRMVAEHAAAAGTPIVLAGRSEKPLAELASQLNVEYRVFALDDDALIDRSLTDVSVIINAAGPFCGRQRSSLRPLSETACIISIRLQSWTAIVLPKNWMPRQRLLA